MAISGIGASSGFSYSFDMNASRTAQVTNSLQGVGDEELIQKAKDGKLNSRDIITSYQMSYMAQSALEEQGAKPAAEQFDYNKIMGILEGLDSKSTGYTGPELSQLSKEEAAQLVSENGFFGIKKTSERISDFVINGAGDDLERLKEGRAGVIQGYKEAESTWGGELPDISKKTLDAALVRIDKRIEALGGSVIDAKA